MPNGLVNALQAFINEVLREFREYMLYWKTFFFKLFKKNLYVNWGEGKLIWPEM